MAETFLTSDLHLGHKGVTQFLKEDGTKLRPWDDVDEMNEALIDNWNKVVSPNDKVYILGDFIWKRKYLPLAGRLKGDKVLIKGNHDTLKAAEYLEYVRDIRACHQLDKLILTHIPIHESQFPRWKGNVHGHLHANQVQTYLGFGDYSPDKRYFNVSVERTNFTPISFEEVRKHYESAPADRNERSE